jgi:hypothetical protein
MVIPEQVGRLQVPMKDRVVLPDESERYLVVEVLAFPTHFLMRLGEQTHRLATAVTSLLAPQHQSLSPLESAFRDVEDAQIGDLAAIGGDVDGDRQPESINE